MVSDRSAVVNGAGPSGLLAAACLASRGYDVQVFEAGTLDFPQSAARSVCYTLSRRTYEAVRACGITSTPLEQNETLELQVHPLQGDPLRLPIPPKTHALAERHETIEHLLAQLHEQYGSRVKVHRQHKLVDIDIDARCLIYSCDGNSVTYTYDLLVAADGVNSPIRAAMCQQVPGFTVETDGKFEARCKTVLPATYKQDRPPGAKSSIHLYELNDPVSKQTPLQYSGAIWVSDHMPGQGPIEGHIHLHLDALPQYKTAADFQRLLDTSRLPKEVTGTMAEQAADPNRWHSSVSRVKCSQLHGPRLVLVGEAAHTVTPHDGQGCNAAMESVEVLGRVLDKVQDLDAVPAAYTRARIKEAHALVDLDRIALSEFGFAGPWHWSFVRQMNNVLVWGTLHRLMPFLVGPPVSIVSMAADGRLLSYDGIQSKNNQRACLTVLAAAFLVWGLTRSLL